MTASFLIQTESLWFYLRVVVSSVQPRGVVLLNTSAYTCACTCVCIFLCSDDVEGGYFMNGNDIH